MDTSGDWEWYRPQWPTAPSGVRRLKNLKKAYIYVKETYIYVKETYIDTHGYLGRLGMVQIAMADALYGASRLKNKRDLYIRKRDLYVRKKTYTEDIHD